MRKKFLSVLLAATLVFSITSVPAYAAEQSVPVTLTVDEPIFDVVVPSTLPITLQPDGTVMTGSGAVITNNSAGPVKITAIQTKGINGWATTGYMTFDRKTAKVDSKQVGMMLGIDTTTVYTTGADVNNFGTAVVSIAKGQSKPLAYNAVLPGQSATLSGAQIVDVVFTVGWDD